MKVMLHTTNREI